jgi:hypothetical protein
LQISTIADCTAASRNQWSIRKEQALCGSEEIRLAEEEAMESDAGDKKDVLSPQEEIAKIAILAECDKLAKAGVTFVAVHFDGYGDDGATEDVKCFDSEYYAYAEQESLADDASHLQEHFEALVPFGYENDCGGFGDVVLDVAARRLTVERNDRFEDYTTATYDV